MMQLTSKPFFPQSMATNHPVATMHHSQHLYRQLTAMAGITRLMNSAWQLDMQLKQILQETCRVLQCSYASFDLLNSQADELRSYTVDQSGLQQRRRPRDGGIVDYVIRTGKVVNVADAVRDNRFLQNMPPAVDPQAQSFLIVPMVSRSGRISGSLQVVNKIQGIFDQKDTQYLMIMADLISMAIQDTLHQNQAREGRQLDKEISRAVDIQRQLLPDKTPQIPGYQLYAYNRASKHVGGDYYDFFPFPRTLSFALADVSGKGVPAALLTANAHAFLHACANEIDSCRSVVQRINNHFCLYTGSDMFATFFWANLNQQTHRLKYVNAGHIPPILLKNDGSLGKLNSHGLPIGIVDSFEYGESELKLEQGDTLILFTDGILEAANSDQQLFGSERIRDIVRDNHFLSAMALGQKILREVHRFMNNSAVSDDMTLMVLKRSE